MVHLEGMEHHRIRGPGRPLPHGGKCTPRRLIRQGRPIRFRIVSKTRNISVLIVKRILSELGSNDKTGCYMVEDMRGVPRLLLC